MSLEQEHPSAEMYSSEQTTESPCRRLMELLLDRLISDIRLSIICTPDEKQWINAGLKFSFL